MYKVLHACQNMVAIKLASILYLIFLKEYIFEGFDS